MDAIRHAPSLSSTQAADTLNHMAALDGVPGYTVAVRITKEQSSVPYASSIPSYSILQDSGDWENSARSASAAWLRPYTISDLPVPTQCIPSVRQSSVFSIFLWFRYASKNRWTVLAASPDCIICSPFLSANVQIMASPCIQIWNIILFLNSCALPSFQSCTGL